MRSRPFQSVFLACCAYVFAPQSASAQSTDVLLNCTACHTLDRAGAETSGANNSRTGKYPVLNGQPAHYIIDQLAAYRSGARLHPQMQQTALALGAGGAVAMARMYANAPVPAMIAPSAPPRSDGTGFDRARDLEAQGAWDRGIAPCALCHVVPQTDAPASLAANTFPRIHGQPEAYLVSTLRDYASGARGTGGMGRMQAYASALTAAEISAVAAYFAAFTPAKED
jgi:cytochrome c553